MKMFHSSNMMEKWSIIIKYDGEVEYHENMIESLDVYVKEQPGDCEINDKLTTAGKDGVLKLTNKH